MGLTKFIFEKMMGWKIEGSFDPSIKKAVVIVVPHTSWHDFYIGAFTRKILKTEINYIAKKELFKWPFGWYFQWMGGAPLDRSPGQNQVEAIAEIIKTKDEFRLALSPEGTRKKVAVWRTGYYYIALAANDAEYPAVALISITESAQPLAHEKLSSLLPSLDRNKEPAFANVI